MGYFVGVDIGTQGSKGIVTDESGKVLASSYKSHDLLTPKPGWAEQDAKEWEKSFFFVLKDLMEKLNSNLKKNIRSITVSGLYGGSGVPVNDKVEPIRPALIWMDRRAKEETEWVKRNVPKDKLVSITGNYVDTYFGFTKIMWIRNNERNVWNETYKFLSPKDYIIYKLTGKIVIDHSSAGNLGGIYDLKKMDWSEEMAEILGIDLKKLPDEIIGSSEIVGKIKGDIARELGIGEDVVVVAGGIDAPVAQLSAGVVEYGEQVVMLGTSMCWGTLQSGQSINPNLVNYPYVVNEKNLIYTFGGGATSGAIVAWLVENFIREEDPYSAMEEEAKKIPPGSEGLVVLPYFMGERSPIWDPDAKGLVFGLSLKHTRAHVYRAFLEGVAYSLLHNIEEAKKAGMDLPRRSYIVGGGAKSDLWMQIMADVTGYEITRLKGNVEAPLGDAFLGCYALRECESYKDIKKWTEEERTFKPQSHPVYEKLYEIYKSLYEKNKDLMRKV